MNWAETHRAAHKKLTLTLICQSPQASALKILALARHPDIEKLYIVPLYEEVGNANYAVHSHIQQNTRHLNDLPPSQRPVSTPAAASPCFLGYDIKPLLKELNVPPEQPLDTASATALLTRAIMGRMPPDDAEAARICNALCTGELPPSARNLGHRPIDFSTIAASDLICCDILRGYDWLAETFAHTPFLNEPAQLDKWTKKTSLPALASATDATLSAEKHAYAACRNISSLADLNACAKTYGEPFVIKLADSVQGNGIFKAARNSHGSWRLYRAGKKISEVPEWLMRHGPVLAMQWLQPSRGDVRALCVDGTVIGAYNRLPAENSELCNLAKGGSAAPYRLSRTEEQMLTRAASELASRGQRWVGFDLMADDTGRRYISEVNLSHVGGIDNIQRFAAETGAPSPADRYAQAVVDAARGQHKSAAIAR